MSERLSVCGRHLATPNKVSTSKTMSSPLTTHVLDTSVGRPAAGVAVSVYRRQDTAGEDGLWERLGDGVTDADGRCRELLTNVAVPAGVYKLSFKTEDYYRGLGKTCFYPYVDIVFTLTSPTEHYHVPLLLSPFGYSTYRGS